PAARSLSRMTGSSVAGPRVAMIFVLRIPTSRRMFRSGPGPAAFHGPLFQGGDRRQCLALEELQEGAAAGRYIGDPPAQAVLFQRCERIAAAGDAEGLRGSDRLGDPPGALAEGIQLEHADRTVPDDGAGLRQQRRVTRSGARADVENHLAGAD